MHIYMLRCFRHWFSFIWSPTVCRISVLFFGNQGFKMEHTNMSRSTTFSNSWCVFGDILGGLWPHGFFYSAWSVKVRILYFSFWGELKCCCSLRCAKPVLPRLLFSTFLSFFFLHFSLFCLSVSYLSFTSILAYERPFFQYVVSSSQWMSPSVPRK